ncbi:MAG: flagellar biosynthetic protein FliR [Betaproteobacteria bacterium]|nr:flagellar biosynthetic protein FliR [Betaproteobacteria bacterium]
MIAIPAGDLYGLINSFFWPFVRLLALIATAPLLNHRTVPARLKIALAIACAIVVAPTLPPMPAVEPFSGEGVLLLLQQSLVGAAIGIAMQFVFAAIELSGDMIGLQMGLSFSGFVDPQNSASTPLIGSFMVMIASLVLLAINGHLMMIASLVESFQAIPIAARPEHGLGLERLISLGGEIFRIGLHLSLPVLATLLALNITMGVLTRAAPQLNVFSVGFPITLLGGLLLLGFALPFVGIAIERSIVQSLSIVGR